MCFHSHSRAARFFSQSDRSWLWAVWWARAGQWQALESASLTANKYLARKPLADADDVKAVIPVFRVDLERLLSRIDRNGYHVSAQQIADSQDGGHCRFRFDCAKIICRVWINADS